MPLDMYIMGSWVPSMFLRQAELRPKLMGYSVSSISKNDEQIKSC